MAPHWSVRPSRQREQTAQRPLLSCLVIIPRPQAFLRLEITSPSRKRMPALTQNALKYVTNTMFVTIIKLEAKSPVKILPRFRNVRRSPCSGNDLCFAPTHRWWDLTFRGLLFSYQLLVAHGKKITALMCQIAGKMGVEPYKIPEFNLGQPGARLEILLLRTMNERGRCLWRHKIKETYKICVAQCPRNQLCNFVQSYQVKYQPITETRSFQT